MNTKLKMARIVPLLATKSESEARFLNIELTPKEARAFDGKTMTMAELDMGPDIEELGFTQNSKVVVQVL